MPPPYYEDGTIAPVSGHTGTTWTATIPHVGTDGIEILLFGGELGSSLSGLIPDPGPLRLGVPWPCAYNTWDLSPDGPPPDFPVSVHSQGNLGTFTYEDADGSVWRKSPIDDHYEYTPDHPDWPIEGPPPVHLVSCVPADGAPAGGDPVQLQGTGFLPGEMTVYFAGVSVTILAATTTTIDILTPAHALGVVNGLVIVPGDSSVGSGIFEYVEPPPPGTSPKRGNVAGGTAVSIHGSGFDETTTVTFGGAPATEIVVLSPSHLTCLTPPHGRGAVNVVVETDGP